MVAKRGSKSASDLGLAVIPGEGRPEPPDDMPDDEAEEWRRVVDAMPPNWFGRQTHGTLRFYCFHLCMAKAATQEMRRLKCAPATEENREEFNRQMKICGHETALTLSAATKLRLTPQSSTRKVIADAAIRNTPRPRPWED